MVLGIKEEERGGVCVCQNRGVGREGCDGGRGSIAGEGRG